MESTHQTTITVENTINSPIEKVWEFWTKPEHIIHWYNASPDWHAPYAENDLQKGGKFKTTMAAKDGSFSFNFEGIYTNIQEYKLIEYTLTDGRKVKISFITDQNTIRIIESFEAENTNPIEMQRTGWQAIVDSFKQYIESKS